MDWQQKEGVETAQARRMQPVQQGQPASEVHSCAKWSRRALQGGLGGVG